MTAVFSLFGGFGLNGAGEMGSGTIYRRGNTWTIGFTVNGQRVREAIGSSKRMAEMVLSKRTSDALQGMYFPQRRNLGRTPFKQFAETYLERVVPLMNSLRTEKTRVLRWMRHFGNRPLGQITRAEIETWRREKLLRCQPATANRDLARLRAMLRRAVEWELLEKSPLEGLKFLRENNARTRYLTLEECERLIQSCLALHIKALVIIALHTGMRRGEILNLRWQDLDLSAGLILIRDSKNGEPRHVPMDSTVQSHLESYPQRPGVDWVFSNSSGERLRDIRGGFHNALRRAELTDLHFHDLRHTYASHWVQSGGDLYVLKDILGHKSITITQRYAHLSPAYKREAVNRMDKIWMGSTAAQPEAPDVGLGLSPVTTRSQSGAGNQPDAAEPLQ